MVRGSIVNTGTGAFSMAAGNLRLAGFGVTFDASRTYASDNTTTGMMGIGWSWASDIRVIPPAPGQTAVPVRAEDGAEAVYTAGSDGACNRSPRTASSRGSAVMRGSGRVAAGRTRAGSK